MSFRVRLFVPEAHRVTADERCSCGHHRSGHEDRLTVWRGRIVDVPGHGGCTAPGCRCQRFKWAGWVFAEQEVAAEVADCC